jgi:hypothetical protein
MLGVIAAQSHWILANTRLDYLSQWALVGEDVNVQPKIMVGGISFKGAYSIDPGLDSSVL